jgi:hypothetical protein
LSDWDDDYDEMQGIVTLEIPLATRGTSGRPKHTDPEEQAAWLRAGVEDYLRHTEKGDDLQVGEPKQVASREERWTEWPD